ncbi:putative adenylate/guanylate cyclase [Meiothermus ruber DSM 1279]|uniref:Adenylate/guanylate cyclase n=1 Tax=Meiothermus ruber (strain ATCC 35948 / DSM 1279 / VKM B-1258 / 21) TaxID=504728 RepID=A0A806CNB9_MEIRD|nr:adenylate/guanylate cyclase domain-containing protein [Meiothermus ruber]ADD28443.1 putative adenylate/guanylate cyclase [Meiothermus ruber DSM 1279]MCX7801573.1 AAA family ATPase [Meiothermus ruber]
MICPRCGHSSADGEEICVRCGNTLLPGGTFVQERRWVSAVFFDLSRFTEYALAHPLEDTWEAANTALQTAASHVRVYGGHIDKFFGDGFLAVFGVPRSQESDARAALEAARAMVASSTLPGRAGVASGLVLRTPLGGGLAGDQTVLGPAINLSQRLSQAAPPGEVWCDETTMRLVPSAITEALPPQPLKGYAEPLSPYRFLGLRPDPPEVLGREREVRILQRALEAVQAGAGRRLVLYGPMGVGKSHLARHLIETLPDGVRGVLAPRLTTGVALRYALQQALHRLLPGGLSQLRQLNLPEHLRTILDFSIGIEEHPGLPSDELDGLLIEAWWTLLARIAQQVPIVVVLEDMHNADPTVLEFTRRPAPPGVLLLMVARQNRWEPADDLETLRLEPLSLEDAQRLILRIRPDLGPAASLHLAEASGGYPLAVQALSLTPTGEPEPIPLFQPRLDSLPRLARVALQAAAVLGVTIPPELVRHLVGEEADLARLVGEGYLEADDRGQLRFAIPWLREAILGQVGGQQVKTWHQQAARWYQRQGRLAEAATHLEAAGDLVAAYRMWRVVAQQTWAEERYSAAILGFLEALRLAEGNVRWQAALEAAEAHLALGRYAEALELASRPLEAQELPLNLRQRAWAIRLEAGLALGQTDLVERLVLHEAASIRRVDSRSCPPEASLGDGDGPGSPEGHETSVPHQLEPRWALALARTLPLEQALALLEGLPPHLEGAARLIRARGWLRSGQLKLAQAQCEDYLREFANSPAETFEARQILSEVLWRQFRLEEALRALGPPPGEVLPSWFSSLYNSNLADLQLDRGQLEEAGALLEESLLLLEGAPPWAIERISRVRLRYLIESGQLEDALYFGESAVARAPSPSLLATLALAYALAPGQHNHQMLQRMLKGLEGQQQPEVQAACALARGIHSWYWERGGADHLRRAAQLARQAHNPRLFFYALLGLGYLHHTRNPKKALTITRYLLRKTAVAGFVVYHGYARLLQAQILLTRGQDPTDLLTFEAKTPLAELWVVLMRGALKGEKPRINTVGFRGYGVLGVLARYFFQRPTGLLKPRSRQLE